MYAHGAGRATTRNVHTPKEEQARFCIDDEAVMMSDAAAVKTVAGRSAGRACTSELVNPVTASAAGATAIVSAFMGPYRDEGARC